MEERDQGLGTLPADHPAMMTPEAMKAVQNLYRRPQAPTKVMGRCTVLPLQSLPLPVPRLPGTPYHNSWGGSSGHGSCGSGVPGSRGTGRGKDCNGSTVHRPMTLVGACGRL